MIDRAMFQVMVGVSVPPVEERPLLGPVKTPLYLRKWGDDYPYLPGESRGLSSCLPVPADSPAQAVVRRIYRLA